MTGSRRRDSTGLASCCSLAVPKTELLTPAGLRGQCLLSNPGPEVRCCIFVWSAGARKKLASRPNTFSTLSATLSTSGRTYNTPFPVTVDSSVDREERVGCRKRRSSPDRRSRLQDSSRQLPNCTCKCAVGMVQRLWPGCSGCCWRFWRFLDVHAAPTCAFSDQKGWFSSARTAEPDDDSCF